MFCFLIFSSFFLDVLRRGLALFHFLFFFLWLIVVLFLWFFPSCCGQFGFSSLSSASFSSSGMLQYQSRTFPRSACLSVFCFLPSRHHLRRLCLVFLLFMLSEALLSFFLGSCLLPGLALFLVGLFFSFPSLCFLVFSSVVCCCCFCFDFLLIFPRCVFLVGIRVLVSDWVLFLVLILASMCIGVRASFASWFCSCPRFWSWSLSWAWSSCCFWLWSWHWLCFCLRCWSWSWSWSCSWAESGCWSELLLLFNS